MSTSEANDIQHYESNSDRVLPLNRAVREALEYEMDNDPSVFMMGEDIAVFGGVYQTATGFLDKYGEHRVRDTPISEAAFISAAGGAAMAGMKPVVELMFIDFMGVCFDPILNFISKHAYHTDGQQGLPMVIVTGAGGGYHDGSQHSQCLYASLAHVPGLKIVLPTTAYDAKGLMHSAIADPNPVVFVLHKRLIGSTWFQMIRESSTMVPEGYYQLPIGEAAVRREGSDITLVGLGETVYHALSAAESLAQEGLSAEVIDLRTLVPLDRDCVRRSVAKTGRLLVIDEDYRTCGIAGEVIASVVEHDVSMLKSTPGRVTFPDNPIPLARPLELHARPDTEKVLTAVRQQF